MAIHKLSRELLSQIAAGEVVERPASAVKELLENAVDAGASRITLEIVKAGKSKILVRDDGSGISREDLPLALAPHATSKIASLADLEAISSLGFRGEALASIASVSKLTLTSRQKEAAGAFSVRVEGEELNPIILPAAHPQGTTVEVCELFFNTPGRRRFLKADRTELLRIKEVFTSIALSHPEIAFDFINDGKKEHSLPAAGGDEGRLKRIIKILGADYQKEALPLKLEAQNLLAEGFLLPPPPLESNACDDIHLILNGRSVEDKLLTHAVRSAYREVNGIRCSCRAVLFLRCPFSEVDVNVHPRKLEVRFHEGRVIHDLLEQAVFKSLLDGGVKQRYVQPNPKLVEEPEAEPSAGLQESLPGFILPDEESELEAQADKIYQAPSLSVQEIADFNSQGSKEQPETAASSVQDLKAVQDELAAQGRISSEDLNTSVSLLSGIQDAAEAIRERSADFYARTVSHESSLAASGASSKSEAVLEADFSQVTKQPAAGQAASEKSAIETDRSSLAQLKEQAAFYDRRVEKEAALDVSRERLLSSLENTLSAVDNAKDEVEILSIPESRVAFIVMDKHYYLLRLDKLQEYLLANDYEKALAENEVAVYALTMPFAVKASSALIRALKQNQEAVRRAGFSISFKKDSIVLNEIPLLLKGCDIAGFALRSLHFIAAAAPSLTKGECPRQLSVLLASASLKTFYALDAARTLLKGVNVRVLKELGDACYELKVAEWARELSLRL